MTFRSLTGGVALLTTALLASGASAQRLTVTVQNLSPTSGTFLTPFWFGIQDGTFNTVQIGANASTAIERIAEDGNFSPLVSAFAASGKGAAQGIVFGNSIPPIMPGETASFSFDVDGTSPMARYFSYASMVIPSNDAFIANDNPMEHRLFSDSGQFQSMDFVIAGNEVLDSGTEINDELPANTAFFGQAAGNTGVNENGIVHLHNGFNAKGSGGILDSPRFANADFRAAGYNIARISITAVPEPGAVALLFGSALSGLTILLRRRRVRREPGGSTIR